MTEAKRYTKEEFAEADQRIEAAQAEVVKATAARAAMVAEHWGCQAGAEVMFRGARYLVSSVDPMFGGAGRKPWLKGRKQKKDGSWGTVDQTIYSEWEHAPPKAP